VDKERKSGSKEREEGYKQSSKIREEGCKQGSKVREEDVIGTPKEMPKAFLSREVLHKQRQKAG
jgi:hypothetical protein